MSALAHLQPSELRPTLGEEFFKSIRLVERLHRQLLDVVKDELERRDRPDVNAVQALLLFNIGDDELSAGELRTRGHYLGSNVSYNLKKLIEAGYIRHQRCPSDRRSIRVRLSEDGQRVRSIVAELFARQLSALGPVARLDPDALEEVNDGLLRLERFWGDHIRYRL
jgi:DNA-binding MarR family transcriptional regulator